MSSVTPLRSDEAMNAMAEEHRERLKQLQSGDGGGSSSKTESVDYHGRLSRLEGSTSVIQWSIAVVSAVLIGGMGFLWNDIKVLQNKVDALPAEVRSELQTLTSTLASAINAAQATPQPAVVIVPQGALGATPATPTAPEPGTPTE